eukprot:m.157539 g.157539  ORF g.157539 m.157539 type:complete len:330 (-) comp16452_c0_seq11:2195-3184(-)
MTFGRITSLNNHDNRSAAQELLEKAAKQVLPVMKKRGWHIGLLVEFFPKNPNLLGLNVNRTQKICVRLRPHNNPRGFYPYEDILGTLLHELTHIVRSPHDDVFYKQLDELKDEVEGLMVRERFGIGPAALSKTSVDTFTGQGNTVGGKPPLGSRAADPREAARKAALARNSGRRLGSASTDDWKKKDPRAMAVEAAVRRRRDQGWCANAQAGLIQVQDEDTLAQGHWQCRVCTLINTKALAPVCEMCGAARPQGAGSKTLPDTALLDDHHHLPLSSSVAPHSCSKSATPAPIAGLGSLQDTRWSCVRCTFANHMALPSCEICGEPRAKR